ncbi:hypothetical protein HDU76_011793 [Blyttiomyces sp. JEL0837]|nr:hypothetical protein HDU76_011793 [Blyttiomyces sp. JEL0837]
MSTMMNIRPRFSTILSTHQRSSIISSSASSASLSSPLTWRSRMMMSTSFEGTDGEKKIYDLLSDALKPVKLNVKDISGGCGAMYAVEVASEQFKGYSLVKQHRMVVSAIEAEIKNAHGGQ